MDLVQNEDVVGLLMCWREGTQGEALESKDRDRVDLTEEIRGTRAHQKTHCLVKSLETRNRFYNSLPKEYPKREFPRLHSSPPTSESLTSPFRSRIQPHDHLQLA